MHPNSLNRRYRDFILSLLIHRVLLSHNCIITFSTIIKKQLADVGATDKTAPGQAQGRDNEITVGRWNDYFLITRRQVGYYSIHHVEPEEASSTTAKRNFRWRRDDKEGRGGYEQTQASPWPPVYNRRRSWRGCNNPIIETSSAEQSFCN